MTNTDIKPDTAPIVSHPNTESIPIKVFVEPEHTVYVEADPDLVAESTRRNEQRSRAMLNLAVTTAWLNLGVIVWMLSLLSSTR